jgi:hypothetical protein
MVTFLDPLAPTYLHIPDDGDYHWSDGLLTDKNSVPWIAESLFPREYGEPAMFNHDQAYKLPHKLWFRKLATADWTLVTVDRAKADALILSGWLAAGVEPWRGNSAECVLRTFGWWNWQTESKSRFGGMPLKMA